VYRTGRQPVKIFWNFTARQLFFFLDSSLYFVQPLSNGDLYTQRILAGFDMEAQKIISVYYNPVFKRAFLGSYTRGLFVAKQADFKTVQSPVKEDNIYYAQAAYDSNTVVTPDGYIIGLQFPGKKMPALQALKLEDHYSMLIAADKSIWVKQGWNIYHFNRDGSVQLHHWQLQEEVTHLYEDSEQHILIGTRKGSLFYLMPGMQVPDLLVKGRWGISYIQEQSAGLFWIGTERGVCRLHFSTRTTDTIAALNNKYIRSLYIRDSNEIWITTYEEGFFLYNGNALVKLPLDKNKYLLTTHCILEDKNGFFWISTNKGLFQASRQDLLNYAHRLQPDVFYFYYEKSSGFQTNEFNGGCQPCGVILESGYFSFPSLNGLVWFRPGSLNAELPDKDLFVNKIEIDLEEKKIRDTISLTGETKRIKCYISTPYFSNPYNLNIEYALMQKPGDSVWLPLDADKSISLSLLSSGTYHLVIRKCNGFGKDNYTYKRLTLVIPPFFYETWWFRALMGLLLILLIWAFSAFRTKYIRNKNRMLEGRIASRTRELEQTLAALQDSEYDLRRQTQIQEKLILAMAHDIKSPLKFMARSAKRMLDNLQEKTGLEKEREEAQVLFESGTKVYYYTENLLQYIRSQTPHNNVIIKPANIFHVVEERVNIFQTIAHDQHSEIINLISPGFTINTNANLLGVIIHNLLDNAVKITIGGKITISARMHERQCILSVKDTGAGMREVLVDWCNQETGRQAGTVEQEQPATHAGMGLFIVKGLVPIINGRLYVERSLQRGTDVQIIIEQATS
jgi:signal transduction histidine kinase